MGHNYIGHNYIGHNYYPGTGKTTIARIVAEMLKALGILSTGELVEVTRADLVAQWAGQTAIKTTKVIETWLWAKSCLSITIWAMTI